MLFEEMKSQEFPIFIWGTGEVAMDVYNYCNFHGVEIEGWFVNVGEKYETFKGKKVYSLEELTDSYSDFSVIIGHSSYESGISFLKSLDGCRNIWYLTSVLYGMWDKIGHDFFEQRMDEIKDIYFGLEDELSKKSFESYFKARYYDKADYMFSCYSGGTGYYSNDVLHLNKNEVLLDVGACVGAAVWQFIEAVDGKYDKIIAVEPDDRNYSVLENEMKNRKIENVLVRKTCIYNKDGMVKFSGNLESGGVKPLADNFEMREAVTIDTICNELSSDISVVKINFPFSVSEVLEGGEKLLRRRKPKLIIRVGFNENVLVDTCMMIKKLNRDYKLYFRYTVGMPQGLTLFAV